MSQNNDEQHSRSATEREIHTALSTARAAWGLYLQAANNAAEAGHNPMQHPQVRSKHLDVHTYTIQAYQTLRSEIKHHLEGQWCGDVPHGEEPPEPIYEGSEYVIRFFKDLDAWQGAFRTETVEVGGRNQMSRTETRVRPNILPPQACKSVVDRLAECRVELGLGANIEADLDEWGTFKMDDDVLPAPFEDWYEFAENEGSEEAQIYE